MNDITYTTAKHEAGHAVMRWILGLPATDVTANGADGFCSGTEGTIKTNQAVLIALAGYAAEADYRSGAVDCEKANTDEFDAARDLIKSDWPLRLPRVDQHGEQAMRLLSVDGAMGSYFARACEMLEPVSEFVDALASELFAKRELPAKRVAELLEQFDRERRGAAASRFHCPE